MDHDLFERIAAGDTEGVRRLLEQRPDLAASRDGSGIGPVLFAAYHRKPELARLIAAVKGELDAFEAAALNDVAALKVNLAASAARVGEWSADGFTALHLACFFGARDTAVHLIDAGAETDCAARNASGVFPLHSAAASGSVEIVQALLAVGATPDVRQAGGFTALHSAAHHANKALVRALVDGGADVSITTEDGRTAADLWPDDAGPPCESLVH